MKMRITIDEHSFEVEVGDLGGRPILVTVDGESFEVWPEENGKVKDAAEPVIRTAPAAAQTSAAVGPVNGTAAKGKGVLAPIPGVILTVTAKEGDSVVFGQELCVLEAMKMKNIIRANRAGKIARICVQAGEQVKHSQMLMEFSD
jgi:biotin carboxyl carrier protein